MMLCILKAVLCIVALTLPDRITKPIFRVRMPSRNIIVPIATSRIALAAHLADVRVVFKMDVL